MFCRLVPCFWNDYCHFLILGNGFSSRCSKQLASLLAELDRIPIIHFSINLRLLLLRGFPNVTNYLANRLKSSAFCMSHSFHCGTNGSAFKRKKEEKIASKLFKMPPFCQSVPFSGEKCMKRGAGGGMEEYHTGPIKMTIFIVDYHLPDQRYTPNGNDRRTSFPYQCRMS